MNDLDGLVCTMRASALDVVRLAWMDTLDGELLAGLNLLALAEYERKPGGGVRVKLTASGFVWEALAKRTEDSGDAAAAAARAAFLEALRYDPEDECI